MSWKLSFGVGIFVFVMGCTGTPVQNKPVPEAVEAERVMDPAKPVELVEVPELLPLPGQLKPIPTGAKAPPDSADPVKRVQLANESARVEPAHANFAGR